MFVVEPIDHQVERRNEGNTWLGAGPGCGLGQRPPTLLLLEVFRIQSAVRRHLAEYWLSLYMFGFAAATKCRSPQCLFRTCHQSAGRLVAVVFSCGSCGGVCTAGPRAWDVGHLPRFNPIAQLGLKPSHTISGNFPTKRKLARFFESPPRHRG